jgi:hypothetical protein
VWPPHEFCLPASESRACPGVRWLRGSITVPADLDQSFMAWAGDPPPGRYGTAGVTVDVCCQAAHVALDSNNAGSDDGSDGGSDTGSDGGSDTGSVGGSDAGSDAGASAATGVAVEVPPSAAEIDAARAAGLTQLTKRTVAVAAWPRGGFCVFKRGGACPPGFAAGAVVLGVLKVPQNLDPAFFTGPGVPAGAAGREGLALELCCREPPAAVNGTGSDPSLSSASVPNPGAGAPFTVMPYDGPSDAASSSDAAAASASDADAAAADADASAASAGTTNATATVAAANGSLPLAAGGLPSCDSMRAAVDSAAGTAGDGVVSATDASALISPGTVLIQSSDNTVLVTGERPTGMADVGTGLVVPFCTVMARREGVMLAASRAAPAPPGRTAARDAVLVAGARERDIEGLLSARRVIAASTNAPPIRASGVVFLATTGAAGIAALGGPPSVTWAPGVPASALIGTAPMPLVLTVAPTATATALTECVIGVTAIDLDTGEPLGTRIELRVAVLPNPAALAWSGPEEVTFRAREGPVTVPGVFSVRITAAFARAYETVFPVKAKTTTTTTTTTTTDTILAGASPVTTGQWASALALTVSASGTGIFAPPATLAVSQSLGNIVVPDTTTGGAGSFALRVEFRGLNASGVVGMWPWGCRCFFFFFFFFFFFDLTSSFHVLIAAADEIIAFVPVTIPVTVLPPRPPTPSIALPLPVLSGAGAALEPAPTGALVRSPDGTVLLLADNSAILRAVLSVTAPAGGRLMAHATTTSGNANISSPGYSAAAQVLAGTAVSGASYGVDVGLDVPGGGATASGPVRVAVEAWLVSAEGVAGAKARAEFAVSAPPPRLAAGQPAQTATVVYAATGGSEVLVGPLASAAVVSTSSPSVGMIDAAVRIVAARTGFRGGLADGFSAFAEGPSSYGPLPAGADAGCVVAFFFFFFLIFSVQHGMAFFSNFFSNFFYHPDTPPAFDTPLGTAVATDAFTGFKGAEVGSTLFADTAMTGAEAWVVTGGRLKVEYKFALAFSPAWGGAWSTWTTGFSEIVVLPSPPALPDGASSATALLGSVPRNGAATTLTSPVLLPRSAWGRVEVTAAIDAGDAVSAALLSAITVLDPIRNVSATAETPFSLAVTATSDTSVPGGVALVRIVVLFDSGRRAVQGGVLRIAVDPPSPVVTLSSSSDAGGKPITVRGGTALTVPNLVKISPGAGGTTLVSITATPRVDTAFDSPGPAVSIADGTLTARVNGNFAGAVTVDVRIVYEIAAFAGTERGASGPAIAARTVSDAGVVASFAVTVTPAADATIALADAVASTALTAAPGLATTVAPFAVIEPMGRDLAVTATAAAPAAFAAGPTVIVTAGTASRPEAVSLAYTLAATAVADGVPLSSAVTVTVAPSSGTGSAAGTPASVTVVVSRSVPAAPVITGDGLGTVASNSSVDDDAGALGSGSGSSIPLVSGEPATEVAVLPITTNGWPITRITVTPSSGTLFDTAPTAVLGADGTIVVTATPPAASTARTGTAVLVIVVYFADGSRTSAPVRLPITVFAPPPVVTVLAAVVVSNEVEVTVVPDFATVAGVIDATTYIEAVSVAGTTSVADVRPRCEAEDTGGSADSVDSVDSVDAAAATDASNGAAAAAAAAAAAVGSLRTWICDLVVTTRATVAGSAVFALRSVSAAGSHRGIDRSFTLVVNPGPPRVTVLGLPSATRTLTVGGSTASLLYVLPQVVHSIAAVDIFEWRVVVTRLAGPATGGVLPTAVVTSAEAVEAATTTAAAATTTAPGEALLSIAVRVAGGVAAVGRFRISVEYRTALAAAHVAALGAVEIATTLPALSVATTVAANATGAGADATATVTIVRGSIAPAPFTVALPDGFAPSAITWAVASADAMYTVSLAIVAPGTLVPAQQQQQEQQQDQQQPQQQQQQPLAGWGLALREDAGPVTVPRQATMVTLTASFEATDADGSTYVVASPAITISVRAIAAAVVPAPGVGTGNGTGTVTTGGIVTVAANGTVVVVPGTAASNQTTNDGGGEDDDGVQVSTTTPVGGDNPTCTEPELPWRCAGTHACVAAIADCVSLGGGGSDGSEDTPGLSCADVDGDGLIACSDGATCGRTAGECAAVSGESQCTAPAAVRCADGSCEADAANCRPLPPCNSGSVRCADGGCASVGCAPPASSGECNTASGKQKCPDGSCQRTCPSIGRSCAAEIPYRCGATTGTGVCVASLSQCPGFTNDDNENDDTDDDDDISAPSAELDTESQHRTGSSIVPYCIDKGAIVAGATLPLATVSTAAHRVSACELEILTKFVPPGLDWTICVNEGPASPAHAESHASWNTPDHGLETPAMRVTFHPAGVARVNSVTCSLADGMSIADLCVLTRLSVSAQWTCAQGTNITEVGGGRVRFSGDALGVSSPLVPGVAIGIAPGRITSPVEGRDDGPTPELAREEMILVGNFSIWWAAFPLASLLIALGVTTGHYIWWRAKRKEKLMSPRLFTDKR